MGTRIDAVIKSTQEQVTIVDFLQDNEDHVGFAIVVEFNGDLSRRNLNSLRVDMNGHGVIDDR